MSFLHAISTRSPRDLDATSTRVIGGGSLPEPMLALVIIDTVVVVLLAGLVAGLLRSHADILKALHDLGAAGDPAARTRSPNGAASRVFSDVSGASAPLRLGPPLPSGRNDSAAYDVEGLGPGGEAVAVAIEDTEHFSLLAFLSSGCTTCAGFWEALAQPRRSGLPNEVRPVVITKGPELESPHEVATRAPEGVTVVMSSRAWDDYEVPGSPFFVLVDGHEHRRVGEGVARDFVQVAELVRRALADARGPQGEVSAAIDNGRERGLDGTQRELANDHDLMAAGIHPGDPSLYPKSLNEVFRDPAGGAP